MIIPFYLPTSIALLLLISSPLAMSNSNSSIHSSSSLMLDWRLISDQVMGGRSNGQLIKERQDDYDCLHLTGKVTTENNGGFLQIAHDLTEAERTDASAAQGLKMMVRGNHETYNIHLRTFDLWLPWQSYRASFEATEQWQTIEVPFSSFLPYKTSKRLDIGKLKRLGIVGIGRNFNADICVAGVQFY